MDARVFCSNVYGSGASSGGSGVAVVAVAVELARAREARGARVVGALLPPRVRDPVARVGIVCGCVVVVWVEEGVVWSRRARGDASRKQGSALVRESVVTLHTWSLGNPINAALPICAALNTIPTNVFCANVETKAADLLRDY